MNLPVTIKHPETFNNSLSAGFDGVFDWGWTNGCFGKGKITPMDFDGVVEKKGNFILFETKGVNVPVPKGQIITLESAYRLKCFTIVFIEGKLSPERVMVWFAPGFKSGAKMDKHVPVNMERMKNLCSDWYKFADKHPSKRHYEFSSACDDVEYYEERAGILEFEAGYSRKDAEELALKMMTERRLQIDAERQRQTQA